MKTSLISLISLIPFLSAAFADERTFTHPQHLPAEIVESLSIGTEFTLYSLDPGPITFFPQSTPKPEESLDGFKILGRLLLTDSKSRSVAVMALTDAIHAADQLRGAMCFRPRHALRVIAKGKVFDFVICYQCERLQVYQNGVVIDEIGIPSAPEALNKLLSAAGVPLAKADPGK